MGQTFPLLREPATITVTHRTTTRMNTGVHETAVTLTAKRHPILAARLLLGRHVAHTVMVVVNLNALEVSLFQFHPERLGLVCS